MTYDHWKTTNPDDEWIGSQEQKRFPSLEPMDTAPRDGSAFRAVLADDVDEQIVTVRFDTETHWWLSEERWLDDNGDGAPDGGFRTWDTDEFQGWLK